MANTSPTVTSIDQRDEHSSRGFGTLGSVLLGLYLAFVAGFAGFPLVDNSFFTHLATGRLILDTGSVPDADPYTFTAAGAPWTVQSWLASVAYAGSEAVGGALGLRLLVLVVFLGAGVATWSLLRPTPSVFGRLGLVTPAVFVAAGLWSPRPYMVAVVGLALVWLALDGRVPPTLLMPFGWIWANTHGSHLLGLALVAAVVVGQVADDRAVRWDRLRADVRVGVWLTLGVLFGIIGPLGTDVVTFPIVAFQKASAFSEIIEWQSPAFRSVSERAFVVLVIVVVLALVRNGRFRLAVPVVVFVAAALLAQRNIVPATVILVAAGASADLSLGTLRVDDRPRLGAAFAAVPAALAVVLALLAVVNPVTDLSSYPARALAAIGPTHVQTGRIAAPIATGNLLGLLDGPHHQVFADDRIDMLPSDVFDDVLALLRATPDASRVLDRWDIDVVVWPARAPLATHLAQSSGWRVAHADGAWLVACRRGTVCPVGV